MVAAKQVFPLLGLIGLAESSKSRADQAMQVRGGPGRDGAGSEACRVMVEQPSCVGMISVSDS